MKYFHILTYIYTLDLSRGNGNLLNFYVRTYIHICTYIYTSLGQFAYFIHLIELTRRTVEHKLAERKSLYLIVLYETRKVHP